MNKIKLALVGIVGLVLGFLGLQSSPIVGSVIPGGEYIATSTTAIPVGMRTLVSNGPATLGSIVVASSSAATLRVWNATSTTDSASTTVAVVKASVGENTFTFDASLTRGLIIELGTGFNGAYTVTYRQN